ncbi:tRNA lysidine(34) synthetase TilS [Undibacterium sp. CY7W]|uniref:tRNA(Ile)-lysidine synthase n=1 Tax=Undibacterium rugosum TaxID=2762291 RepID=A0A923KSF5_9BURK|nr:tRNA lysidine(34) synthetase TilS [Undibacterium rugosum]MBC3934879.1 tRNA lysidine(34) synthetase TilS [Undibacterium rugosum]
MKSDKNEIALRRKFSDVLGSCLQKSSAHQAPSLAVAYSGGLDSSVLLTLAHAYCRQHQIPLHAFHVHHGLSPNADDWLAHCEAKCRELGIVFRAARVKVDLSSGLGTEASARKERYAALGQLCIAHGVGHILTAHHQDDQAETILMQMLRGSGLAGLSGMDLTNAAPGLLGTPDLVIIRPLLESNREELEQFQRLYDLDFVEDESNTDVRYRRNALRHRVMPILEEIYPGFAARMSRGARHVSAARDLIEEMAVSDLAQCTQDDQLQLARLVALGKSRAAHVFRHWLSQQGVRLPSTARLHEIFKQLFDAKSDARIEIHCGEHVLHRYRDAVYLQQVGGSLSGLDEVGFSWNGESSLAFPAYGGVLHFELAEQGISSEWLSRHSLVLHLRRGGERMKLAIDRPTRDMKSHFQSLNIPFWVRSELPFVSAGAELLYAAQVGMNAKFFDQDSTTKVSLHWVFDESGKNVWNNN